MLINDPRGELYWISRFTHHRHGDFAYSWSPDGTGHSCNALDILKRDCPELDSNCAFIAAGLIPVSHSNGKFFELMSQSWLKSIFKTDVLHNDTTYFARLADILNSIEGNPQAWADFLQIMLDSGDKKLIATAGEMLTRQQDAPREFGNIISEFTAHLGFLSNPDLLKSLSNPDFSLEDLCKEPACKIFLNVKAEHLSIYAHILRVFYTTTMLYKARYPAAKRITLLVDEAGQMGNFGASALSDFIGSAQLRQFLGTRDLNTARLISGMAGAATLEFDNSLAQEEAATKRKEMIRAVLEGADPFDQVLQMKQMSVAQAHRSKQQRQLIDPAEVLSLAEDQQIVFISGKDLPPLLLNKYPYYTRREMRGQYVNNLYHPPADKVQVRGLFGQKWVNLVHTPVPAHLSQYPQLQDTDIVHLEGQKPW